MRQIPGTYIGRIFLALILTFLAYTYLQAQGSLALADHRKREILEFKLIKNLIIIPVMVEGKGPYNFVLDTGVGLTIITDSTIISNLSGLRTIKITGLGEGHSVDAYRTSNVSVQIGNSISGVIQAAVLKQDAFNLSGFTGIPIHGLIGWEFFTNFIVRIDYDLKTLIAYNQDRPYIPRRGTRVPITIEDNKPYVDAEVGLPGRKITVKLIIDTGAGHPISLESLNNKPFGLPPVHIPGNLGIGLLGPITGSLGRISYLKLGKFEIKNMISAFPDSSSSGMKTLTADRNGNLGNTILKRFSVVFDYYRECIYLKPGINFNERYEHDMSGMELTASGKDFDRLMITRVEPGSSADDTGLVADDEVLSINLKPVKTMSLQEIDDLFRSRPQRSFILDVVPKDSKKVERVILTLKRRI